MATLGIVHWPLLMLGCRVRPRSCELKRSVYEPTESLDPDSEYEKGTHGLYLLTQDRWSM